MAQIGKVTATFAANSRGMEQSVSRLKRSFSGLQAGIVTLNQAFQLGTSIFRGVSRTFGQITSQIQTLTRAAAIQEEAEKRRNAALVAAGKLTANYAKELNAQAAAFQKVTTFGDETIIALQQQFIAFGATRENIKELTAATLDLSTGMGVELKAAALLMGKALAGEFGTLSRYGIFVDENATKTQKLQQALDQISMRFAGQARAAAETYQGAIKQLSNTWGDYQETQGTAITENRVVITVIKETQKIIEEMNEALKTNTDAWQRWIGDAVILALEGLKGLNLVLGFTITTLEAVAIRLKALKNLDISPFLKSNAELSGKLEEKFFALGRVIDRLIEAAKEAREKGSDLDKALRGLKESTEDLTKATKEDTDAIEARNKAWDEAQKRAQALGDLRMKIAEGVKRTLADEKQARGDAFDNEQEQERRLGDVREQIARGIAKTQEEEKAAAEKRLKELGEVSINVGREISRAVGDAFQGVILGTSKLADVGKNLFAALLRSATQFFADVIVQKLSFEQLIFTNLRGFLPAASSAVAAGAVAIPGVAGASTGGGGALGASPFGSLLSSAANLILPGLGGFALGGLVGGGSTASRIGGSLGGIAGSLIGSFPFPIAAAAAGPILGSLTGGITSAISGVLGAGVGSLIGGLILPGIGAIAGGLLGGLFGGGSKRKRTSPARRARAFDIGLEKTLAAGFELLAGEEELIRSAAQISLIGVAEQLNVSIKDLLAQLSPGALVLRFEQTLAKGGRALGGLPIIREELARRGFGEPGFDGFRTGVRDPTPHGLTPELVAQVQVQQLEAALAEERIQLEAILAEERLQREEALEVIFKEQVKSLEFQITLIGKSAEEAAGLRREFELIQLAAQGFSESQITTLGALAKQRDDLIFQLEKEALLEAERALQETERLQRLQRFETLAESIATQIEETAFQIAVFGKNLEDTLAARRILDLSRLTAEGLSPLELDLLSGLMRERDKLALELSELQNPGPVNIEITINGNINDQEDVRDLARRLGVIITGQVAPFSN